ncbi:MAG: PilZ domain-containing protein [Desulfohalobiaceae bacterium]
MKISYQEGILAAFRDVKKEGRTVIVAMPAEATENFSLSCTLKSYAKEHLHLAGPLVEESNPEWAGFTVSCCFDLSLSRADKGGASFKFSTSIIKAEKTPAGSVELILAMPDSLDMGRMRFSPRVEPDPKQILGFYLWESGRFIGTSKDGQKPILYPPLLHLEHISSGTLTIVDISAGGMKFHMSLKVFRDMGQTWNEGTSLVLRLVLRSPSGEESEEHWLKCKVKYRLEDFMGGTLDIGLEFTHYGKVNNGKKLKWSQIQGNVAEELCAWTQKRYLEQHHMQTRN